MKKTTLLILLLSILSISNLIAQTDDYVILPNNGGTSSNGRGPQGARPATRSVWLVTASEIAASGLTTGDVISVLKFNYAVGQDIETAGTMTIYMQNTTDTANNKSLTWADAISGMTTVSDGAVTLPFYNGEWLFNFSGGAPFTYTGDGLYIAFDYQNFSNPLSSINTVLCNTTMAGGVKSALAAATATTPPTTLTASAFRPETKLGKIVPCPRVDAFDFSNLQPTSADLWWNSYMVNDSDLEYGPYGYTQGTGTLLPNVQQTYTLNGLAPNTIYDCYIKNNCQNGFDSVWNGPFPFCTEFLPVDPTYTTSFEQEAFDFLGWTQISPLQSSAWQLGNFGPPSVTNTLTQDGSTSIYSLSGITTTARNNWIISRGVNLVAGSDVSVSFYTRNYQAASSTGTASYNVTVGNAKTEASQTTIVGTETNNANTAWVLKTYSFTPPTSGVYYFGLQNTSAANAVGQQALFVDNLSITQTLKVNEFLSSKFSVYPNPANNVINFSNTENAVVDTIELSDLNGRIIKSLQVNATEGQISVNDLASGVYMMKIATDQGIATKKFVRQ